MSNKIGFWSVFALVTGSQIGTAVFMLPTALAAYGGYGVTGWLISGVGAIALALVFAFLCSSFPKTGGPHVYVKEAFGPNLAFFTGWTYWVISWVSTPVVVITAISYLSPIIGDQSNKFYLGLQIALLLSITGLNLRGIKIAGRAEIFLTLLKFIPLLVMSFVALFYYDKANFVIDSKVSTIPVSNILGQVTLLTLWGFIGLETATTPAGSVENPSKTIPRAIIFGTTCVALLYLINSVGILGMIPGSELMHSKAPYVDAAQRMFGGNWHLTISIIASVVCIGTLNAWILTSGQIILGLSEDGFVPKLFSKTNENNAPVVGILASSVGIIPLLILTADEDFTKQMKDIIDFSVSAFLFVYLICSLALLKLSFINNNSNKFLQVIAALISVIFCSWVIYETPINTLLVASSFVISGLPVYLFWYKRAKVGTKQA